MSDISDRFLSAARRYCEERHNLWATKYSVLAKEGKDRSGYEYTDEALATFPRYNVLGAILTDLERLTGSDIGSFERARETVLLAGQTAQNEFTSPMGKIDEDAMNEERQLFADYVRGLTEESVRETSPLAYRRVMSEEEVSELRAKISATWGIPQGYWYPLSDKTHDKIEAYQDRHFHAGLPIENLRRILRSRNVIRVLEVREYGPCHEVDLDIFEPIYNGAEGFFVSEDMGWIMYASHESSITVGGWLLDEIQTEWPVHAQFVWQTPFFE